MAKIIFYTKPGCLGGVRQKEILLAAGHSVEERSSLDTPWTPESLREFLRELPLAEWYNPSAPAVKSGQVVPGALPAQQTLELLCQQPILIRRPLLQIGERKMAGFYVEKLREYITMPDMVEENVNECRMKTEGETCPVVQN